MLATLAFAAFVLLGAQTVLVAIVNAVRPKGNVYVTIILVSLGTAPLAWLYGTNYLGQPLGPSGRMHFVLMHLALGGFLFHFMTLPDRSVTLRILVEVLLAPGQALSLATLAERYGVRTMIGSRLHQLSAGGFIEILDDRRIRLTPKGLAFGRFVSRGRTLFDIESGN
jgi:hypothetical protein